MTGIYHGLDLAVQPANAVGSEIRAEVVQALTARARLVDRVVVQRYADRVVVGVEHVALGRVDQLWHFRERQDFVIRRLVGLRVRYRQPLVRRCTGAVADEPRR